MIAFYDRRYRKVKAIKVYVSMGPVKGMEVVVKYGEPCSFPIRTPE